MFPANPRNKRPLVEDGAGHLDAVGADGAEQIASWWGEFPHAIPAINTGASGVVVLDLDNKDGKNGFESVEDGWLEVPASPTEYPTPNNGRHVVYRAPQGVRLNGVRAYRKLEGVDRRAGSSYALFYGEQVIPVSELPEAPAWLCDPAEERTGASFDGGLDEWLAAAPEGEPTEKMLLAIEAFPAVPFGHPQLIEAQYRVVRSAAEGAPGALAALEELRARWLTPPWDTDDHRYEFDAGLYGAIRKAGAQDERIAALPDYAQTLGSAPEALLTSHIFGPPKPRKNWFAALKALASTELSDSQIATLVWNGPGTKEHSRDFGIDYLYEQLAAARQKAAEESAPRENPSLVTLERGSVNKESLLSQNERDLVAACPTFVDRWLAVAGKRVNVLNAPYHVQNAWTILSLSLGLTGFLPYKSGAVGLNLFQLALGESSSGKSQSISLRDAFLREFFMDDPEYNLGSAVSTEWLHEQLLKRDQLVSFFNADEAAKLFRKMNERGGYLNGLEDALAEYYEGYIGAVGKKSAKEIAGKTAIVSFNLAMFGTPKRVTEALTRDMWLSGFLARVVWTIGEPPVESDAAYSESQNDELVHSEEEVDDHDEAMRALAVEFRAVRRLNGSRRPVKATREALSRMAANRKAMTLLYRDHENWDLLEPSVKRLGDVVRKCSALLALASGRTEVGLVDALTAISYAEVWLANVEKISRDISDNQFTRDCDTIELYVRAQGGTVTESQLAHRFRAMGTGDIRDFYGRVTALQVQGRLAKEEATNSRGVRWKVNEVLAVASEEK